MGLEERVNFVGGQLTTIVEGVKGFGKHVATVGILKALISFEDAPVFVGFAVTAEGIFHSVVNGIDGI
jgi:hypothetical protein